MKIYRIYATVLHYFYIFKSSPDRITDVFYWPTIDIIVWGLTGAYFAANSSIPEFIPMLLSGIILWSLVFTAQREITFGLLEELWNRNLINVFSTPLKFSEWVMSIVITSFLKALVGFLFASILAIMLYHMNIFSYGLSLLPFAALLTMTAWSVGFFVTGMIFRYTQRIQTLAWSTMGVIAPFSAIYYSVDILPEWAQRVASVIPTSYIFEGMREVISTGHVDLGKLLAALMLNSIYMISALIFLKKSYNKVLENGLAKLY